MKGAIVLLKYSGLTHGALWVTVVILAVAVPLRLQSRKDVYTIDTPAGRIAVIGKEIGERYEWLAERTRPGEMFFAAFQPQVYFPLHLSNPTEVAFVVRTGYTRPEQVQNIVKTLELHHVRFVLWSPVEMEMATVTGGRGDALGPLELYLQAKYRTVKVFPGLHQIWERKEGSK